MAKHDGQNAAAILAELDAIVERMALAERESLEEWDKYFGHAYYLWEHDTSLPQNAGRLLTLIESHCESRWMLRWLADHLSCEASVASYLSLQALDGVLYGTRPVATSVDVTGKPDRPRRPSWPDRIEDEYGDKHAEVLHERYRGEWGHTFLRDLAAKLEAESDQSAEGSQ